MYCTVDDCHFSNIKGDSQQDGLSINIISQSICFWLVSETGYENMEAFDLIL